MIRVRIGYELMAGVGTPWPLTLGRVGGGQHVEYDLTIDMKTKMHGKWGFPPLPPRDMRRWGATMSLLSWRTTSPPWTDYMAESGGCVGSNWGAIWRLGMKIWEKPLFAHQQLCRRKYGAALSKQQQK